MIYQLEVRSALGQLLTLDFDTTDNGLIVQNIDGLGPVQATLVSSSFATLDGALYQSSRRETRNIIITLGLEPDYITNTVRGLRTQLYQFFMPKSQVGLRFFMDGEPTVEISGRVESFETILFTPEPKAIISIICYDPDFSELTATEIDGSTVADTTETLVTYDGTVEAGFVLALLVDRTLEVFTVYNRTDDSVTRTMDFAISLVADDILTVSTITGNKYVHLTRSSVTTSVLYSMSPQSNWLEFLPGANNIRVFAEGAAIPYTIDYTTKYGGL